MNPLKLLTYWSLFLTTTQTILVGMIVYFCFSSVMAYADECAPLYSLSNEQWEVLQKAYDMGAPHDLGNTMAAIAWTESTAGKYRINPDSNDYGVMHNNIKTAANRRGVKGYYATRALMTELVVNDQLSMELALEELMYWDKHTDSWASMVSAYNNGWAYEHGTNHTQTMRTNTRMMMDCAYLDTMFNEETPMHEEAVGDLVATFEENKDKQLPLQLEPKVIGSFSGTKPYGTGMASSSETATLWESLKARLSRMWT